MHVRLKSGYLPTHIIKRVPGNEANVTPTSVNFFTWNMDTIPALLTPTWKATGDLEKDVKKEGGHSVDGCGLHGSRRHSCHVQARGFV